MIKRFENIFLDNTSNEKIEDDEGQCGTLRVMMIILLQFIHIRIKAE